MSKTKNKEIKKERTPRKPVKKIKKSDASATFTEREIRLANLRNNKIPKEYLTNLILSYKANKRLDPDFGMPTELAETVLIIIDKMLGSSAWRGYTPDWKEEFRGKAIEHVLKYVHNFSIEKCKEGKNDPYNYIAMISKQAFVQSWRKLKLYSENNININHDVIFKEENWNSENELKEGVDIQVNPTMEYLDWGNEHLQ